jgi:hypothetical protein
VVPPEKRVLNVKVTPSEKNYRPGQKAKLSLQLTDYYGEPFQGSTVISIYDRALEYISGGSNVPEIRSFFWKWRRHHRLNQQSSLARWFYNQLKKNEAPMKNIGVFGHLMIPGTPGKEQVAGEAKARSQVVAEAGAARAPAPAEADESSPAFQLKKDVADRFADRESQAGQPEDLVQPGVRTQFADTAFWSGSITTDSKGMAAVEFDMPENLTGWKVKVWAMGHGTKVGEGDAEVVTRKDLIVRLQAPRFFMETDEVVLSANVHNYLKKVGIRKEKKKC